MKRCSKCHQVLPLTEFYKERSNLDGVGGYCKPCMDARGRTYHAANRSTRNAQNKAWYAANREKKIAASLAYDRANPQKRNERSRRYRQRKRALRDTCQE